MRVEENFLALIQQYEVLRWGEFTLKSGQQSTYFFDMGAFVTNHALAQVGQCFAQMIVERQLKFDVLFGPAYKGIILASATATALAQQYGVDCEWACNRKETKTHGEKGTTIGADLTGKRVLVIDDVFTQGTAWRESSTIIAHNEGKVIGLIVGLDRQEKGSRDKCPDTFVTLTTLHAAVQYLQQSRNSIAHKFTGNSI